MWVSIKRITKITFDEYFYVNNNNNNINKKTYK